MDFILDLPTKKEEEVIIKFDGKNKYLSVDYTHIYMINNKLIC
jgi:hypothetical protein